MFPKMPGQMVIGQQAAQVMGQHPNMMPQGGMPVRMPQGQPFVGGPQPQLPATLGNSGVRGPGPTGTPAGFFPQGPGMQGPDVRLLQERQLQHRMQMAKLQQQQQQMMMGQQPIPHTGNPQATIIPQNQSGMIGNPVMSQQQVNTQQGMLPNQASQQGMMQVPQGVVGGQTVVSLQQNLAGQPIHHAQAMAGQPGIMGTQQLSEQQRPMQMLNQQGMLGSPGHTGIRGPHNNLTPQQNILAQRMLASQQQQLQLQQQQQQQLQLQQLQQQQSVEKNMIQFQQQQAQKQQQPMQVSSQTSQDQGLSQPSTPQMGSSPCAGSVTPQPHGLTDNQTPCPKESGLLSPESKTPPQHSGPSTPSQVHQVVSANQLQQNQKQDHSNLQKQTGLIGNQQAVMLQLQQQQQQPLLTLQRQGSVTDEKPSMMNIKEEVKTIDVSSQQQQAGQSPMMQSQDSSMQLQVLGQPHPGQQQPTVIGHSPQQQALIAQQQKQQAMMGIIRAQQQGITPQRPALQPGQIRTPVNIQAIIAQNPQLRNLPPNQQIQHIQAIIAQRQLQQGQMLRMSMGQGQMRAHMPPGQVVQVGQQHQSNMLQPGVNSQMQQGMMVPGQQQSHAGELVQNISRNQAPVPPSPVEHGRMAMPASPCQPLANPPGDPQRHAFNQNMAMRPPTPNQNQQALMAAGGRLQGSPSHAYSPRGPFGMSPVHPASPHSSHASSPSMGDGRAGRGSPYNQVKASPLRSPGAKSPLDSLVLKVETQPLGNETCQTASGIPNGPQKGLNIKQQTQQISEGLGPHVQHGSSGEELGRFSLQNIKQEPREVHCDGAAMANSKAVKREVTGEAVTSGNNAGFINDGNMTGEPGNQGPRSETGQQLLQKLLKTKNLQLGAQRPSDGIHNEINGHINTKLAMLEQKLQGTPQNMEVRLFNVFLFFLL